MFNNKSDFGNHFRGNRVNQLHTSGAFLAGHHWYPDKNMMKEYSGKDMLVSDEQWQKILDIGIEVNISIR